MDNLNLIDTFSEFKDLKSIDRATMMSFLKTLSGVFCRNSLVLMRISMSSLILIRGTLKSGETEQ